MAVISPALPKNGLPGLASGASRAMTRRASAVKFDHRQRGPSPGRDRAAAGLVVLTARYSADRRLAVVLPARPPRGPAGPRRGCRRIGLGRAGQLPVSALAAWPAPILVERAQLSRCRPRPAPAGGSASRDSRRPRRGTADDAATIHLPYVLAMSGLVAAEIFIDFADEGFGRIGGKRQVYPHATGMYASRFLPHPK